MTAIKLSTDYSSAPEWPAFAILHLAFVPEPGTALLLGVAFVVLGVHRQRRNPLGVAP